MSQLRERLEELRERGDPELAPLWIEALEPRRAQKEVLDRDGEVFRLQEAHILIELGRREEARQLLGGLRDLPGGLAVVRADLLKAVSETAAEPEGQGPPGQESLATKTLAELYAAQGNLEESLAIYREVLAREPGDEEARRRIGELSGQEEMKPEGEGAGPQLEQWLERIRSWRKVRRD